MGGAVGGSSLLGGFAPLVELGVGSRGVGGVVASGAGGGILSVSVSGGVRVGGSRWGVTVC